MNRKIRTMALAVAACFVASFASAAVVFTDGFDYATNDAFVVEGGWTAWSGTGGCNAGESFMWGNAGAWLEYNDTTPVVAGKVIVTDGTVSRTGGYGYTMSIDLWDGSDTNSRVTVAGGVQELSPGTALTPVSYRTVPGDAGKYIIFKYEHTQNWGQTDDLTLSLNDPTAPTWSTNSIPGADALTTLAYSGTLAGLATDADGDAITYSKVSGPAWLSVAGDGTLSGTPDAGDIGANAFVVRATDVDGSSDSTLNITVTAFVFDPSGSTSISINFAQNDSNQGFAGGQNIGPLANDSANWNTSIDRDSGSLATGTLAGMIDDTGTNTGATISWSSANVWYNGVGVGSDQQNLAVGYLDDTSPGLSVTVSNIPYASYKVYGLFASGQSTTVMNSLNFQVNGTWVYAGDETTLTPSYGSINANNTANGTYWTETVPGVSTGNYWTIEGSSSSITITGITNSAPSRGSLAGVIIQNLDNAPLPPVWNEIPVEESGITGRAFSGTLAGKATDPNAGDTVTFSKASGPAWLTVATSGALSGTPVTIGTNVFQVVATDGTTPVTNTLNVTVQAGLAPTWTTDPMQGSDGINGYAYSGSLAGLATDPNGDPLTYSKTGGPAWLSVAANGDLTGTPGIGDVGPNAFTVSVADGIDGSDSAGLNIEVIAAPSTVLIDNTTANGSFELPATGKVMFNSGTIPNWTNWSEVDTADNDTGTDTAVPANHNGLDGTRVAFLQPGGAILNMSTRPLAKGDVIVYSFWNSNPGRVQATISLVYDDGGIHTNITGTAIVTAPGTQGIGVFTVQDGDPWIGSTFGVGIQSGGSWPEVDQVYLALTPGTAGPVADLGIGVVSGGAEIALSWTSEANGTYTVQTNGNLIISSGWADFGPSIPGTGGPLSVTNAIGSGPALFYRIKTN